MLGAYMNTKQILLLILLLTSSCAFSTSHIDNLSLLLGDSYSSEIKNHRKTQKLKFSEGEYQLVTYRIEGLEGGNSFSEIVALFKVTQKINNEKAPFGPVKNRLVDIVILGTSGTEYIHNIHSSNNEITFEMKPIRGEATRELRYFLSEQGLTLAR